jgi:anti-sigma factor RsiW
MNAHPDPKALALWAGGETDAAEELGSHLQQCAECRGTVEEFERTRELLLGALAEPSEFDLQLVRRGVARHLDVRQRGLRWSWSLCGALAALVVVCIFSRHREQPTLAVAQPAVQLPILRKPMHLALSLPEVKRVTRPPVRRSNDGAEAGLRAVNLVPRADGSTELRLTTADPNVVILLPVVERRIEQ